MLLTMAAILMMLRFVDRRLLSTHPFVYSLGTTALLAAAHGGHESTVRLLLEHLADVNARNM
jgi:hypothetical protein